MAKIIVNKIDLNTKMFIEQAEIEEETFEQNNDGTLIQTPVPQSFQSPMWNGTQWVEGKTTEELIEIKKNIKNIQLTDACNSEIVSGFLSASTGYTFEFEVHDQSNFTQQSVLLLNDPTIATVSWKTANNGIQTLTRDQFFTVVKESEQHKRANIGKLWQLKALVEQATTIEEVEGINW
jgi:hypothetical protein